MLTAIDQENLKKSVQNAKDLVQNLQKLAAAETRLLTDIALDLIPPAISLAQWLLRVESALCPSDLPVNGLFNFNLLEVSYELKNK